MTLSKFKKYIISNNNMIPIVSNKIHSNAFSQHLCQVKCKMMKHVCDLDEKKYEKCINLCNLIKPQGNSNTK